MAFEKECCFFGRGSAYMSDTDGSGSWSFNFGNAWNVSGNSAGVGTFLGNISKLEIVPQYEYIQKIAYRPGYVTPECTTGELKSLTVNMTLSCFSNKNLSEALFGQTYSNNLTSTVVTDEIVSMPSGGFEACTFIKFKNPGIDASTVVVKIFNSSGVAIQTLVAGTDYVASSMGIELKIGLTFISGETVRVSYTYSAGFSRVEAFVNNPKPKRIVLVGMNMASDKDDKSFCVVLHKLRLNPTSAIQLINQDQFTDIELSGTLEADTSITNPLQSKYFFFERIA